MNYLLLKPFSLLSLYPLCFVSHHEWQILFACPLILQALSSTFIFLLEHQTPAQIQAADSSLLITSSYRVLYSKSASPCKVSTTPKFIHLKLQKCYEVPLPLYRNESSGSRDLQHPPTHKDQKCVEKHQWQHAPAGKGSGPLECLIKNKELKWAQKTSSDQRHKMFCENHPN